MFPTMSEQWLSRPNDYQQPLRGSLMEGSLPVTPPAVSLEDKTKTMKYILSAIGAIIISVVISMAFLGGFKGHSILGAISNPATVLDFLQLQQGLQIPAGPSVSTALWGSQIQGVFQGTCNATFSGTSLAATSTGQFFCPVTGVVANDKVFVSLPGTARTGANMWFDVADTYATTTGAIGFDISNFTGTATTSFAQATTGVQYLIIR